MLILMLMLMLMSRYLFALNGFCNAASSFWSLMWPKKCSCSACFQTAFVMSAEEHDPVRIVCDASTDTVELLRKDEKAEVVVVPWICLLVGVWHAVNDDSCPAATVCVDNCSSIVLMWVAGTSRLMTSVSDSMQVGPINVRLVYTDRWAEDQYV